VLAFTGRPADFPARANRDGALGLTGSSGFSGALNTAWDGLTHSGLDVGLWANGRPIPWAGGRRRKRQPAGHRFLSWIARNFDRSVTWKDLDWVRETWDRPIVVKGVLDVADAKDRVKAGAQGLVVSNHGGRQLDGVRSSISALPASPRRWARTWRSTWTAGSARG